MFDGRPSPLIVISGKGAEMIKEKMNKPVNEELMMAMARRYHKNDKKNENNRIRME